MNRSINLLSLSLILALSACSVSNDEQKQATLPSLIQPKEFIESVRGKAVFTAASDMQLLFNETGDQARIIAGQPLTSDKYEYTFIEKVSYTVAIYSVTESTGKKYIVFKLLSHNMKDIKLMKSDLLNTLEEAQELAKSNELDKDLHEYGSLIRPADPSITAYNQPFSIFRDLIKGKILTAPTSGGRILVKDNGNIIYKGKALSLMFVTVDQATIADSRRFSGKYYDFSTSSAPQYSLSINIPYFVLNDMKPAEFFGAITLQDPSNKLPILPGCISPLKTSIKIN